MRKIVFLMTVFLITSCAPRYQYPTTKHGYSKQKSDSKKYITSKSWY